MMMEQMNRVYAGSASSSVAARERQRSDYTGVNKRIRRRRIWEISFQILLLHFFNNIISR